MNANSTKDDKRNKGQYYTKENPFNLKPFKDWLFDITDENTTILEPFAGANYLVKHLQDIGFKGTFKCHDCDPKESVVNNVSITKRDTIKNFPKGYSVCVTNPPYLSKSSASRKGIKYCGGAFDDIYKKCLQLMLDNCDYVAAIIPDSFITSGFFTERLHTYISLTGNYFDDTEVPVGLALFQKEYVPFNSYAFYTNNFYHGTFEPLLLCEDGFGINHVKIKFNDKHGSLGIYNIDSTTHDRIRFCNGNEISSSKINDNRGKTKVSISASFEIEYERLVEACNNSLYQFRTYSQDIFLTSFKGKRNDGFYRRRLSFNYSRLIIKVTLMRMYNLWNDKFDYSETPF